MLDDCIDFAYPSMFLTGVGKPVFIWFVQQWVKKHPDAALPLMLRSTTGQPDRIP
jgi:hypothetical protein